MSARTLRPGTPARYVDAEPWEPAHYTVVRDDGDGWLTVVDAGQPVTDRGLWFAIEREYVTPLPASSWP